LEADDSEVFKTVVGVPTQIEGLKAKVNYIACGDFQSFANVNLS